MRCPTCQNKNSKVLDSRPIEEGRSIRRRRECDACGYRFTTFERTEKLPLMVVKKDGVRQEFNREKVTRGIMKACEKRPVSADAIEEMVHQIEKQLHNKNVAEIDSKEIGERVMEQLAQFDEVAYVRFASVYRQFKDITVFMNELKELIDADKKSN